MSNRSLCWLRMTVLKALAIAFAHSIIAPSIMGCAPEATLPTANVLKARKSSPSRLRWRPRNADWGGSCSSAEREMAEIRWLEIGKRPSKGFGKGAILGQGREVSLACYAAV